MSITIAPRGRGRQPIEPAEPLRALRSRSGYSISQIADFLEVEDATITQSELTKTNAIGKNKLYALADLYELDPRVLEGILPIPDDWIPLKKL
jgi:transcriptional regulator with XRE-family HTH domain